MWGRDVSISVFNQGLNRKISELMPNTLVNWHLAIIIHTSEQSTSLSSPIISLSCRVFLLFCIILYVLLLIKALCKDALLMLKLTLLSRKQVRL